MPSEKILIVDDEEDILELVKYNLLKEGYKIECAGTGEEALEILNKSKIDLMVLDLMMPGIDGLEVTKKVKWDEKLGNIPIIMLTAKSEESDIVIGLEMGADDYVTKPFSPRVLIARIKANLRKTNKGDNLNEEDRSFQIHELTIDFDRRTVNVDDKSLDLTFSEFEILVLLTKRPGWVFTRSKIVDLIRGDDYPVTDRSVDVQITGLRKKLGKYSNYIETVRGVGYRFKE